MTLRRSVTEKEVAPITRPATEFELVRSLLGPTQHRCLTRWPLRA